MKTVKKILKADEHIDFGKKLILPAGVDLSPKKACTHPL